MAKTKAEIPAETTAATRSEYQPALLIDQIKPHPRNIRHDAVADDELVESIRENGLYQPLTVTPVAGRDDRYDLLDGHRRLDGLRKAGFTHAPAIIRHDIDDEAAQVAVMLGTDHKEPLSPLEEAEGYDLLAELGWTDVQIAKAAGRSQRTIIQRRKLTRLSDKAKASVHEGQVTIEDAITLAQLPAKVAREVEKHFGNSGFRYEIQRANERVRRQAEIDDKAAAYTKQGIPEKPWPKDAYNEYYLSHAKHGMVRLSETGAREADEHDGCLAFSRGGTRDYPQLYLVCTDPGRHEDQLTDVQREAATRRASEDAEREARIQAEKERHDRERIARQLRVDSILAGIKLPKLDPVLADVLRLGYAAHLEFDTPAYGEVYRETLQIPADQWSPTSWEPEPAWREHIAQAGPVDVLRALLTHLILAYEHSLTESTLPGIEVTATDQACAATYGDLLDQVGHGRNDVDDELLAAVISADLDPGDGDD